MRTRTLTRLLVLPAALALPLLAAAPAQAAANCAVGVTLATCHANYAADLTDEGDDIATAYVEWVQAGDATQYALGQGFDAIVLYPKQLAQKTCPTAVTYAWVEGTEPPEALVADVQNCV